MKGLYSFSIIILTSLVFVGAFAATAYAVSSDVTADYEWRLIEDDDGNIAIQADASAAADDSVGGFRWEISTDGTAGVSKSGSIPVVEFTTGDDLNPGKSYNLTVTFYDTVAAAGAGSPTADRLSKTYSVAIPSFTLDERCEPTSGGSSIYLTADIVYGDTVDLIATNAGLGDPTVTFFEDDSGSGSGKPIATLDSPPYEYQHEDHTNDFYAEAEFSDSDITLRSNTVTGQDYPSYCDEPQANFGYSYDDLEITVTALSPYGEYTWQWDFDGEGSASGWGPESYEFTNPGTKDITLTALGRAGSGNPDVSITKTIPIGGESSYSDMDGDGEADDGETEDEEEPDRDGDGTPDDDDPCPDDPEDNCEVTDTPEEPAPAGGLVNCVNDCDWQDFIALINRLITWLIGLATVIATLLFMYAGFLYLTAAGNESQADQAKGIFTNVAIGFGIILIAWLVVSTIVSLLTSQEWRQRNNELLPIDFSQKIEYQYEISQHDIEPENHA